MFWKFYQRTTDNTPLILKVCKNLLFYCLFFNRNIEKVFIYTQTHRNKYKVFTFTLHCPIAQMKAFLQDKQSLGVYNNLSTQVVKCF